MPALQAGARGGVQARPAAERAERLRAQAACGGPGPTSGLVAFRGGEPVGWCAVEPRTAYPGLLRVYRVPWAGRAEDKADASVWAVTCFFVRAGFRRQGVSYALARAAVGFARARGARALEGYPMLTAPGQEITWGELSVGAAQHLRGRGVPGGEPSVAKAGGDAGGVWVRLDRIRDELTWPLHKFVRNCVHEDGAQL